MQAETECTNALSLQKHTCMKTLMHSYKQASWNDLRGKLIKNIQEFLNLSDLSDQSYVIGASSMEPFKNLEEKQTGHLRST